jgi:hypothetical protein
MESMAAFYEDLGFVIDRDMAPMMCSACLGDVKINLHAPGLWESGELWPFGDTFDLRGPAAVPGCGDLCLVWDGTEAELEAFLDGVDIIEGPVTRRGGMDGGRAAGTSRYIRDPECNLVEFIVYPQV